jgi:hypothetical protein
MVTCGELHFAFAPRHRFLLFSSLTTTFKHPDPMISPEIARGDCCCIFSLPDRNLYKSHREIIRIKIPVALGQNKLSADPTHGIEAPLFLNLSSIQNA